MPDIGELDVKRAGEEPVALAPTEVQIFRRLAIDAATAELARALRREGIRWLLLKGPAVARRLYQDGTPRPYGDIDVLVGPDSYAATAAVATELGYTFALRLPRIEVEHADTWERSSDRATIDLHRSFPHIGVDPAVAWRAVTERTEEMVIGGEPVEVCGRPALALLMALHALHHGPHTSKPLADLERAVKHISIAEWRNASTLADDLGAERNFAAGLALTPASVQLARTLGLPAVPRWEVRLRSGDVMRLSSPLKLMGETRGLKRKLAVLREELFPSKESRPIFEKEYSSRSPVLIFLRRIGRLARNTPLALVAWYLDRKDRRAR